MNNLQRIALSLAAGFLMFAAVSPTQARPFFSSDCTQCHTPESGHMEVVDFDDEIGLDARLDGGTSDPLKTYTVAPGDTVSLTVNVIDGANKYAVAVSGLDGTGVLNSISNVLDVVPDPDWVSQGGGTYYTSSANGTEWTGEATKWTFDLLVNDTTPEDFYAVELRVSGKGSQWTQGEEVYLQVASMIPEPATWVMLSGLTAMCLMGLWRRRDR